MSDLSSFYEVITAAINDIQTYGYDSQARVSRWLSAIRNSAYKTLTPLPVMEKELRGTFKTIYGRMVEKGGLLKLNPGVSRYSIDKVKPKLRSELDRRMAASANLIKLNRIAAIQTTEQRFSGWATSVPEGGSKAIDKQEVKKDLRKALAQLPFEERRVAIDQGHKFTSALNEILAVDNNAIAGEWHSKFRQPGYDYREDHKERDSRVYLIRGNWAEEKGLVVVGPAGYTDDITKPGEEVFCSCTYKYIYAIRNLPANMLTQKGKEMLNKVRIS